MNLSGRILSLSCLALVLGTGPVAAQVRLDAFVSEDLEIIFPGQAFAYLVPHVAACSENALRFHEELYDWTPSERISFLLEDFSDYGHGGANTVPTNFVNFGVAPFNYVYETIPAIDRMYWMANHELAHIVTMDQAAGRDLLWRRLFGGKVTPVPEQPLTILYNYQTTPRWNAPRWYHEGIAVFLETWMGGGLGRVLGGYDEMVFRSMTRDGAHFYDVVGLESEGTTIDFQVGVNSYLYGTRFMTYLAYHYGPQSLIEWTGRYPGSAPHFATQFRKVYGRSLDQAWSEWIAWEKEWQGGNLERIRRNPTTPVQPLADARLGSVSRIFRDPQEPTIYFAVRYPGQFAHLAAFDLESGRLEKLTEIKGPAIYYVTSLAFDPEERVLFYTSDNYGWRDLNAYDIDTGRKRRLMKDLRVGDLAFNRADRSLWGVRHFNGISTLVRLQYPYDEWDQVRSFPYGTDLYDIDVSPDGRWLTGAVARIDGTQQLVRMSIEALRARDAEPQELFDFEHSAPSNFVFSPDGRYLYGSSYYSGVSNVFRYDFELGDMSVLTNAESGFFRPTPIGDSLLALHYTGRGLVPVEIPDQPLEKVGAIRFLGTEIANEYPVVREWRAPPPSLVQVDETFDRTQYRSLREMRLNHYYPTVEGYRDSAAVGMRLNLSDGLNLSGLDLSVSYTPDSSVDSDERYHLIADFHHWGWSVKAQVNPTDFYDLFGPTKTSRRGYSLGFGWDKVLLYDEPRELSLSTSLTGWGGLDTLPDFQEIEAPTPELVTGRVSLDYAFLRKSLGAVEDEAGVEWSLLAATDWADGDFIPRLKFDFDWGLLTPIRHSSLWLRTSVGHTFSDREDAFAQYFFGGFGNNYVDFRVVDRYREWYSFPGLEINEVGGKNYGKAMLEWTLPPMRFRRAGVPSFYLNWVRPALFTSVLGTDLDDSDLEQTLWNAGAQLDLRMVVFSNLPMTLSFGYAVADGDDRLSSSDEWMLSLKIL